MARVKMYDDNKGYIGNTRYERYVLTANGGNLRGTFLVNEDNGRAFIVRNDDGTSTTVKADEIRNEVRKTALFNKIADSD